MRNSLQTAFAVAFGVLLVATATLGGVVGPGSSSVETAEAQSLGTVATTPTFGAALVEKVSSIFTNNPDADELEGLDAQETEQSIYDEASIQQQNNELVQTAYGNYLNDTESIALMEGKNSYIRALENGSSESVARNRATEAVADYYATKQLNIKASWNTSATVMKSAKKTAINTTGVNSSFVWFTGNGPEDEYPPEFLKLHNSNASYLESKSVTLVNSSTRDTLAYNITSGRESFDSEDAVQTEVGVSDGPSIIYEPSNDAYIERAEGVAVRGPNDNFDNMEVVNFEDYANRWSQIEQQNDEVQSQLDSFIDNTYSSYQQGDINTSDLVDPYLGARSYDPETSDTWTLRSLSSMGIEPPENLSNVGRMNVSVGGTTYTGTLMSDGTPDGGYAVGGTYNASNITGLQFVATDDGGAEKLDGEFTLESVETADGEVYEEGETVEYKTINYQTANTSEFKALQEDLDQLTAEINAKQQQERNAGGGGLLPDFGSGGAIPGAILLGGAVVLLISRS